MAVQVWDYASDGYVHRLVQSKTDGKLVEVPSPAQAAFGERASTDCPEYAPESVLLAACFINCISQQPLPILLQFLECTGSDVGFQ